MEYLDNMPTPDEIKEAMDNRDMSMFLRPYIG